MPHTEFKHMVVNYHYVENPREDFRGIFPCPIDEFEKQVAFLSDHFTVTSLESVFAASQKGSEEKICAISFDDGLKDQYMNAVPILERYKTHATFFIITSVFEGFLPSAHRIHVLLSKHSAEEIIDLFNGFQNSYVISKKERIHAERRLFEDVMTANLKETIMAISSQLQNSFLEKCFNYFSLDAEAYSQELFMNAHEVEDIARRGFSIGSHSHSHYVNQYMKKDEAQKDISLSCTILKDILGEYPTIFSYPHGRYNDDVIEVLRGEKFKYACSIENRPLGDNENPYAIPRLDSNDLRTIMKNL